MIEVTNGEVWAAQGALQQVCREPWPVKTAYWLAKLTRKVREVATDIDQVRRTLIEQYGEKNDQGQMSVVVNGPHWAEFERDWTALLGADCTLDIDLVVLPDVGDLRVTPDVLLALEPFVAVQAA